MSAGLAQLRRARGLAGPAGRCYRVVVFGIGSTELIVIAVVALMLFSPKELPKIMRSVAKFWGSLRATADEFRDAIMNEEGMEEVRDAYQGTRTQLRRVEDSARREMMKARMDMQRAQQKLAAATRASEDARKDEEAKKMNADQGTDAAEAGVPVAAAAPTRRPAPELTTQTDGPAEKTGPGDGGKGMSQGAA